MTGPGEDQSWRTQYLPSHSQAMVRTTYFKMFWHGPSEVLMSREAWVTIDDPARRRPKCEDVVFSPIRSEARSHQLKALTMDDFTMHCSWDSCWKLYFKGNAINTKLALHIVTFWKNIVQISTDKHRSNCFLKSLDELDEIKKIFCDFWQNFEIRNLYFTHYLPYQNVSLFHSLLF